MRIDDSHPPHLLLIHQAFASPGEAGGTRHFELARRLTARGVDFTVVASRVSYLTGRRGANELPSRQEIDGVCICRAWTPSIMHSSFVWRVVSFLAFMVSSLWPALRCGRVDLVIGTSPPMFQALSAWLVAAIRRRPFLLEIRDLWPEFAIEMGVLKHRALIGLARRLESFLYARATHILVNSPAYRDYLLRRGIAAEKISFIANGVDPDLFSNVLASGKVREEFRLDGKFVATYAGALGLANDISMILEAAAQLADDPQIHILLVGDGKERPALQRRADELGLKNVTFAGTCPKEAMPAVLAASDVCLATLQDIPMFRTTYPNKVFDYMAAGKPTVLAIDGVIRDVITACEGGVFVPPGNATALAGALRQLKSQPEERRRMGARARDYVSRHFHRGQQAAELQDLVSRLIGRPLPVPSAPAKAA